jgi:hypothetical protein
MSQYTIYQWEDEGQIVFIPSMKGLVSQFAYRDARAIRLRLYWNPETRSVSTTPSPTARVIPPEIGESDVKKVRGFLLDAGFPHRKGPNLVMVNSDDKTTRIFYPKWIEEDRWNQRYEEAAQRVILGKLPGIGDWPTPKVDFLGWAENVVIFKDRFISKTRGALPFKIWWGHWQVSPERETRGTDLVSTIEEAVDIITRTKLLLPESAKPDWERANVNRGEFIVPSPEEVEVFRVLDQELPFLLSSKELEEWIAGRGSA